MALLLVVTVASAATAADMRGLLALAHAWVPLLILTPQRLGDQPSVYQGCHRPTGVLTHSFSSIETSPPVDSISKSGSARCSLPVTNANNNPNTSPTAANIAESPESRMVPPSTHSVNGSSVFRVGQVQCNYREQ